ncbi:hypothetical protein [Amylibacter sp. IMCC11727]|uniref:hypothetical protein n=1 Tax=Amylibacter sp. IMCC11727 TaxID=3039851 RepID=UPI00244E3523|nr:hypothetical protein [Amylibacter sp. IMCC11727]WGI23451.1 hypothetical protein QBD29_08495 [Amylibacter sp. IMCC11727]
MRNGLQYIMMTCAATCTLAAPALALDTSACFQPATTLTSVTDDLAKDGWETTTDRSDLVIEHLTWTGMPQYFAGDSGGQSLANVLDMKRMSARGILRKKDLPDAQTRILTRQTDTQIELAKVVWVAVSPTQTTIHCTFSVGASSVDNWATHVPNPDAMPLFLRIPHSNASLDQTQASQDIVALNRASLSQDLGVPVPSDAIIETYLSFLAKEN